MIVVPIVGDQPYCAQRCAALRVARTVDSGNRNPEAILTAVRDVLSDASYATNARRSQAEMQSLPGADSMIDLLKSLQQKAIATA